MTPDWLQQAVDAANAQSVANQPVTVHINYYDYSTHDNRVVNVVHQQLPAQTNERRLPQIGQCTPSRFHPITGKFMSDFPQSEADDIASAALSGMW